MPWLYTAGNYDGTVQVYFEADISVTAGGTGYAGLHNTAGTIVTGSEVSTTATGVTRVRSGDLLANLADGTAYQVRIKSSSGATVTIHACRIVIIQTGTITKTETIIPLGSNGTTTSGSYIEDANKGYWLYDAGKWDGASFYYEAFLSGSAAGVTGYSQLYTTGGAALSGSEVSQLGTTDTRVRSGALTLADATTYRAHYHSSTSTARVRAARIVVVQTSFNKTETYYPMGHVSTATATPVDLNNLAHFDAQEWDVYLREHFFEATMAAPSGQTVYADLNDGTNDDATVSSTSTSKTRVRSSSLTPDDDTDYVAQVRTSSGTGSIATAFLIVQATLVSPNSAPTIALNTADASVLDTTPTLEFTGSDVDGDDLRYNIQISSAADFRADGIAIGDSYEIGGGSIVHPNPIPDVFAWTGDIQMDDRVGQSFTAVGGILDKIAVRFGPDVDTDGTVYIRVYTHAGVFGTSSAPLDAALPADTPTPGWLAKSDAFVFDTAGTLDWHEITFSGANRIYLQPGEHYIFMLDWVPNDALYDNTITTRHDGITLTHGGNVYMDGAAEANNGVWADLDMLFRVYEDTLLLDKVSGTDSGFANTVTGGDTDPFNAGEKVSFTVQAGDELTDGVTYFWRARVIDPGGSNTYSSWSETRSFSVSAGGAGIEGQVNKTLDDVTVTSTGTLPIAGAASITLDAATISSAGAVAIAGAANPTLDATTISGAGVLGIAGEATPTVDTVTISGTGTLALAGTADVNIDATTILASGAVSISGTATPTLDGVTVTATGGLALTGQLSTGLEDASLAATGAGQITTSGALDGTLDDAVISSSGVLALSGDFAQTLDVVSVSSTGALAIAGTSDLQTDAVTISSNGTLAISGILAAGVGDIGLTAEGNSQVNAYGAADLTLDSVTISGTAEVAISGTAGINLEAASVSGFGVLTIAGTASPQLETVAADISGVIAITGSLGNSLDAVSLSAFGASHLVANIAAFTVYLGTELDIPVYICQDKDFDLHVQQVVPMELEL